MRASLGNFFISQPPGSLVVMDASKWTEKTRAAVSAADEAAQRAGCSQVEPVHVAAATLDDPVGIARAAVLRASGGDEGTVAALRRTLQRVASKLPTVRPPPSEPPSISPALAKVLRGALRRMESRHDVYMAMDTLWMACLDDSKARARKASHSQRFGPQPALPGLLLGPWSPAHRVSLGAHAMRAACTHARRGGCAWKHLPRA